MFLVSCRTVMYHKSEQCAPAFVYVDESLKLIDAEKSICSVRDYEFALHRVGPVPGSEKIMPIQYCDRCVGFKDYAATATFWEQVRREIARKPK
jgi:hypothetical protein